MVYIDNYPTFAPTYKKEKTRRFKKNNKNALFNNRKESNNFHKSRW